MNPGLWGPRSHYADSVIVATISLMSPKNQTQRKLNGFMKEWVLAPPLTGGEATEG